jgi:predicted metal-dependent peptidase
VAVAQARQVARARGELPEGLARLVEQVLRPKVDWREVLREFIARHAHNDYRWFPPNRRFVHRGLYLPGLRSEELGDLVVAVDTSGSIGGPMLARFAAEVQGMLEAFDATLTVLYHDARVQHVQTWRSSDGPLVLEPRGGGGTDHAPVFGWVERNGIEPGALVCLTDLHTRFPARAPGYPTLWCAVNNAQAQAPFGQVLTIE